jgi:hypothetical protein
VGHVWDQRETTNILIEIFVEAWAATGTECPDHILPIIDIDIFSHKNKTVDSIACFVVENQITNLLAELGSGGL